MKRREFITLLGGAAVAWPLAARAQQPMIPVIGFLESKSPDDSAHIVAAFRRGLNESTFIEGQNVTIEFRWARGQNDRLAALAVELVRRQVAVIATFDIASAFAAKAATTTIPIVFNTSIDPVAAGLVASLNRPGGNVTGITSLNTVVISKRLEMLHELVPAARIIALLVNPASPKPAEATTTDAQAATRTLGLQLHVVTASSPRDIDTAFTTLAQQGTAALVVSSDALFNSRSEQIAALAARHAIPAIYPAREYVAAGGLISYGTSLSDIYRQVGLYTGKILKGEKPAELPVQQSTKVELVINPKTAKTLGLTFPLTLLARADEVIE
jgi:putative ABC transport system substrate-binding protein